MYSSSLIGKRKDWYRTASFESLRIAKESVLVNLRTSFPSFSSTLQSLSHFASNRYRIDLRLFNMIPGTSPSASTLTGTCAVCGQESSTRCSNCSQAGLDWMFFCSKEHQTLVRKLCSCRQILELRRSTTDLETSQAHLQESIAAVQIPGFHTGGDR